MPLKNMSAKMVDQKQDKELKIVPIDSIEIWNEANVRHTEITAGIDELAESIKQIGLQQPLVVQETELGKYKLIEGQRRLLALQSLGKKQVQVLILKKPYDRPHAMVASLAENLHRKAVAPRDLSDACDYLSKHFGSDKEAAKIIGISLPTFKKYLGYKAVPEELKKLVAEHVISVSDALRLSQVPDLSKALEFARLIHKLAKPAKERLFIALLEDPSRPLAAIQLRADQLKHTIVFRVHLPETYANALYRASDDSKLDPEAVAQRVVMDWLESRGYVK
jgi:ParB family chromosome partitioning protein